MIDFTLSDNQTCLRQEARDFARLHLAGAFSIYSKHADQTSRFQATKPIYKAAFSNGLIKKQIPIALGGSLENMVDMALLVEELYAVDPTPALSILGTGLGLTPLIVAGTPEQQGRLIKPYLDNEGEILASFMHSEPTGTANWLEKGGQGLQTTAYKDGNEWIINGDKLWATNSSGWDGNGADLMCVVCRLSSDPFQPQDPHVDPASLILILIVTRETINANEPGAFQVISQPELAGHDGTSGPHCRFINMRVPSKDLLAEPGKGANVVNATFGSSAAIVGAMAVGLMRASFEIALAYAKSEKRGGTLLLIQRQSVANLLIDIKIRIETTRLIVWKALHCLESGPGDSKARLELMLEAKVFGSDNAAKSVMDAMNLVGISSYAKEMKLSRLLNDAICLPLFDGGNVGVRRRQIEQIFSENDYEPWASTFNNLSEA